MCGFFGAYLAEYNEKFKYYNIFITLLEATHMQLNYEKTKNGHRISKQIIIKNNQVYMRAQKKKTQVKE